MSRVFNNPLEVASRKSVWTILLRCALVVLFPLAAGQAASQAAENRPNLITIVTDDQGRWAMGLYGNREIQTPNMDQLAREGALYSNAFVATPVCSPSRATYLTGRWPTELGVTDWITKAEGVSGVGLDARTWPQVLQQHGYRTGLIGKWHLGSLPQHHPTRLGFDLFTGFLGGGERPMNPTLEVAGVSQRQEGPMPDVLVDHAIEFLRSNKGRPFALSLHFRAPHTPYAPVPKVDSQPYRDRDLNSPEFEGADADQVLLRTRLYYASVTSIDRNLGRLMKELTALGLDQNTIVIFTSDHGYNEGRHGITTKGNGRWMAGGVLGPVRPNMWDTSLRVPLVVRWPGVVEAGSRVENVVSNIDMFRTVLGALSIPVPEGALVRGLDFSPLFRGQPIPARDYLFGQYDLHNQGLAYMRMIRSGKYKYVRHFKANLMDELYDLENDPGETQDLLSDRNRVRWVEVVRAMRARLTSWQESIEDPILTSSY